MVNTLNGLEKAVGETKLRSQKMADQFEALSSKLDDFIWEIRAAFASPLLTLPKFDGSRALVWLARANQYFLIKKTPSDRRVDVAIDAMSGPATTWLKLLLMRCSSLSWDKFTQELLRRFGDTSPPESSVSCKPSSEGPIGAAVQVAKYQPKVPPTPNNTAAAAAVISPLCSAAVASKNPPDEVPPTPSNNTAAILPTVTAPLLPLCHDFPSFQPPSIPLPEQKLIPAAATFQSTPTASLSESIHALACPVRNVSRPSSAAASHIEHFLSADNERSNKLHLLLHVYGQIFVCTLTSDCKHEYDPPPTMYCVFGFQIQPCGQGCFESEAVDTKWRVYQRGSREVVWPTESANPEEEFVADGS